MADEEWYIPSPSDYGVGGFASQDEDGYISSPDVHSARRLSKKDQSWGSCEDLCFFKLNS